MSNNKSVKAVYVITKNNGRTFWTKIGIAFVNRDGSLNVKLNSLPIDGEMHIRDMEDKTALGPFQDPPPDEDGQS